MSLTIATSVVAFSIVILLLVFILLFAQSKLVQSGDVNIVINGDSENPIITSAGSTLLSTLSSQKMFLPSACGGGGTCAMCKCTISEGGGDVLPTEVGHLSRSEKASNVRLSCQVKVKQDMKIEIPEEIFGIKKWECEVVSNYNVSTFIKEFVVKLPPGETLNFESGGYIQIDVPETEINFKEMDISPHPDLGHKKDVFKGDWDKFNLWPLKMKNDEPIFRAYSMANHPAEGNIIMLNIRIASPPPGTDYPPGICSSYVFDLQPGDKITISGPYGEFFAQETDREMCFIGGGAGMAPMRSHIYDQLKRIKTDRRITFWYGGRSERELFYIDEFRELEKQFPNFTLHIALSDPLPEDNWEGSTGFIHQVCMDEYLDKHPDPTEVEYYLCGPPIMLQCVNEMVDQLGVEPDMVRADDFGI